MDGGRVLIQGPRSENPGEERLVPLTYHPTIELALQAVSERVLRDLAPGEGWEPSEVPAAIVTLVPRLREAMAEAIQGLP